ncbi:MAG TPA: aspartyl protease family protein, partial [Blastocatellia bacterium]|nr:aspartyl protease family protein [Blastocatellia bacterium]
SEAGKLVENISFTDVYDYDLKCPDITLPVVMTVSGLEQKTLAKVDTGSTACIFERGHGEALGLDIESGSRRSFGTVTGSFVAYGHIIGLSFLRISFDEVTVYFADDPAIRRNVLGREGWLQRLRLGIVDHDGKLYAASYNWSPRPF